jgi:hypothetical protein
MLYDYTHCAIVPAKIANTSIAAFVLGIGGGLLYGSALLIYTAIAEWRYRRAL